MASDSFSKLTYHERYDIQEWVLANPALLGEPLLVVATEFSGFDKTSERLDVLALDPEGKLVVVELKRTAIGTIADLQALRYAAYCSTMKLDDIAELRAEYRTRRGTKTTPEEALAEIRQFVEVVEFEQLDDKPRIILAADAFGDEMTATALWLRSFQIDVRCVRLTPYTVDGTLLVDSSVLIPVPEAEEFMIRREKKEAARSSSGREGRPTVEEFVESVPERVRPAFTRLRSAFISRDDVKETAFKTLLSYRRASDNAWIGWLQYVSSEARLGLPPEVEPPEELVVRSSNGGWPILGVASDGQVEAGVELIGRAFARLAENSGNG